MSENDETPVIKTQKQQRQEEMAELADKFLPDEIEITEAELDTKNRAPKGEQFGYKKDS